MTKLSDPFAAARADSGLLTIRDREEEIPLLLRHADIRAAAKDWETFSSDAPFRVPIPAEETMRSVRQLPIESDPPLHTAFRKLLEPTFRRPTRPEYCEAIEALIDRMLDAALAQGELEVIADFALPLQSRALTQLLGMPESEAAIWEAWGTSMFRDGSGESKGRVLEDYLRAQLERAAAEPEGEDFFCAMTRMEVDGRKLTEDEMLGIGNLVFAGGRDTVINTAAMVIGHFASDPDSIRKAADSTRGTNLAAEEIVRATTPLTHIGRVCSHGAQLGAEPGAERAAPGQRIGLTWAAGNFDPEVFACPEAINLERSPNPHLGYGHGPHNCLGSQHARAILRGMIRLMAKKVQAVEIRSAEPNVEDEGSYVRRFGYAKLEIAIS